MLRVSLEPRVAGLVDRASAFFELASIDAEPSARPARIERAAMRELGRLDQAADVASELAQCGVPSSTSARFAADLASARWKGTVTRAVTNGSAPGTSGAGSRRRRLGPRGWGWVRYQEERPSRSHREWPEKPCTTVWSACERAHRSSPSAAAAPPPL